MGNVNEEYRRRQQAIQDQKWDDFQRITGTFKYAQPPAYKPDDYSWAHKPKKTSSGQSDSSADFWATVFAPSPAQPAPPSVPFTHVKTQAEIEEEERQEQERALRRLEEEKHRAKVREVFRKRDAGEHLTLDDKKLIAEELERQAQLEEYNRKMAIKRQQEAELARKKMIFGLKAGAAAVAVLVGVGIISNIHEQRKQALAKEYPALSLRMSSNMSFYLEQSPQLSVASKKSYQSCPDFLGCPEVATLPAGEKGCIAFSVELDSGGFPSSGRYYIEKFQKSADLSDAALCGFADKKSPFCNIAPLKFACNSKEMDSVLQELKARVTAADLSQSQPAPEEKSAALPAPAELSPQRQALKAAGQYYIVSTASTNMLQGPHPEQLVFYTALKDSCFIVSGRGTHADEYARMMGYDEKSGKNVYGYVKQSDLVEAPKSVTYENCNINLTTTDRRSEVRMEEVQDPKTKKWIVREIQNDPAVAKAQGANGTFYTVKPEALHLRTSWSVASDSKMKLASGSCVMGTGKKTEIEGFAPVLVMTGGKNFESGYVKKEYLEPAGKNMTYKDCLAISAP